MFEVDQGHTAGVDDPARPPNHCLGIQDGLLMTQRSGAVEVLSCTI